MAQIRKATHEKTPVHQRITQLSQKITNIHLSKPQNPKKYQLLDCMCQDIQKQLQNYKKFSEQKLSDIRHKSNKITKQIQKDHITLDILLKKQIENTNQRLLMILDQEHQAQKQSNIKILQYIEHQTNIIKNQIDKQSYTRQEQGQSITQSLNSDIDQIIKILDQTTEEYRYKSQNISEKVNERTQRLGHNLIQICETYGNNQAEFYKMLRDLVKKVKNQIEDHKIKRQQTQTQILNLIDKMCDKTITQKNI